MKILSQSTILLFSFLCIYGWGLSPLSGYTIQAIALLIFFYLIFSALRKRRGKTSVANGYFDIFLLNTVILLLILNTGGLYSPLFFLSYFLGFGITFVFEPLTVFVYTIGVVLLFLPDTLKNGAIESFIRIGSLMLICPLAYYFGQGYKERDRNVIDKEEPMTEQITDTANTIAKDVEAVLEANNKNLSDTDIEKLNDILEETEGLRTESKIKKVKKRSNL